MKTPKRTKQEQIEFDWYDTSFRKIYAVLDDLSTKSGLYRIYNKRKKLIYVGISENIKKRVKTHLYKSVDRPGLRKQIYYIKVHNTDIVAAKKLEEEIIRFAYPFFNNLGRFYQKKEKYNKIYLPWDYPYVRTDRYMYLRGLENKELMKGVFDEH